MEQSQRLGVGILVIFAAFGVYGLFVLLGFVHEPGYQSVVAGPEPSSLEKQVVLLRADLNSLSYDMNQALNQLSLNQAAIFSQLSFSNCFQLVSDENGSRVFPLLQAEFFEDELSLGNGLKQGVLVLNGNLVCPQGGN